MRAILFTPDSVNQRAASEPLTMSGALSENAFGSGTEKYVNPLLAVLKRPMRPASMTVTHRLPSGLAAIETAERPGSFRTR